MKYLVLVAFVLFSNSCFSQEEIPNNNFSVKWAPTGLVVGSLSLQGEYNKGKNSFTAKIGLPVKSKHRLEYDDKDADFDLKAMSLHAGYRHYISKNHMKGLYIEPFIKYLKHVSKGNGTGTLDNDPVVFRFDNEYKGFGAGAQLGAQFLVGKRFVIDLFFLGPEINISRNTLNAVESSNTIPWTSVEAADAEEQIRDFIEQFPFIRNNTDITVDQQNKTVKAEFQGLLPGIRTGVSFGFRF